MSLPAIDPGVLRVDDDGVTLLGGWSPTSGRRHFHGGPVVRSRAPSDVDPVDLPRAGAVWLRARVTDAPPGCIGPIPYGLGVVELDGEPLLRVVTRLSGEHVAPGPVWTSEARSCPVPTGHPR